MKKTRTVFSGRPDNASLKRRSSLSASVTILLMTFTLVVGVCGGFLFSRQHVPGSLSETTDAGAIAVNSESYTDSHDVAVTVTSGTGQTVTTPRPGVITATRCMPSDTVDSGMSPLSLNGVPVLALHTDIPPYRDLTIGMAGDDARALNAELRRLGYAAPNGRTVTRQTIDAYNALAAKTGADSVGDVNGTGNSAGSNGSHIAVASWTIPADAFIWLEADSAVIGSCAVAKGTKVEVGTTLLTTSPAPRSATAALPASGTVSGAHALTVGGVQYDLNSFDSDSVTGSTASVVSVSVSDVSLLQALVASDEYRAERNSDRVGSQNAKDGTNTSSNTSPSSSTDSDASSVTVTLRWSLKDPVTVWNVPPSALYDVTAIDGTSTACLISDDKPRTVTVVASELGKAKVSVDADSGDLGKVQINPDDHPRCR